MKNKQKTAETIIQGIFLLLGLITVGCVLLITVYLVISGIPAIRKIGLANFLFGTKWASTAEDASYGILPFILTSIYGTAGAIAIGVPIGFLTSVYLAKAAPAKIKSVINAAVILLAGIPSVVYGLVGMLVLVPAIRSAFNIPDGASLLAAIIVLAYRISKRIVEPLNSIDLDKPLENEAYDELAPLLTHIERQKEQIHNQYKELEVRKSEFYAIIENMNEGLVLLSRDYTVLSINPAAGAFFSASPECIGKDFLTLERNHEINKALDNAVQDGRSEIEVSRNGHEYQLNISRIGSDEQTSGVVILVFDISDKVFAERNRKEFTANVSHELKTPLQSIMGSAELLENGLVKADDVPKFIGRIRSEAARLVTLIEDIIRLSQLDESTDFPLEDADIYEIAKDEAEMLSLTAQKRNVTISVKGKSTVIHAPKQLLHEIIYNLCDNAIKYNKEGGSVEVSVEESDNNVMLSVSDTGIGIPLDNQNRVFERFYRVDKSHSKETGGTGLGLSIVKHAVQYLNGKISLESTVGKGTKISVAFRV